MKKTKFFKNLNPTYYVYLMAEKPSPTGQPYVGCTMDIKERARDWRRKLKLEHKPHLEVIATFEEEKEAYEFEQETRVKNGWKRESNNRFREVLRRKTTRSLRVDNMKQVGKQQGQKNKELGLGIFKYSKEERVAFLTRSIKGSRFMVHTDGTVVRAAPDQIEQYLALGFVYGRKLVTKRPRRNKK